MVLIKNPLSGGGGGFDTMENGKIQEFKASTGSAGLPGTFIEFATTVGTGTSIEGSSVAVAPVCCDLGDGRVFVVYRKGSTGNRYGLIATLSEGSVSFGTETLISTNTTQSYDDTYVSALPDGSKVAVSWRGNSTTDYIVFCGISGTSITVGTPNTYAQGSGGFGPQGVEWAGTGSLPSVLWGVSYSASDARCMFVICNDDLSADIKTATTISSSKGLFDMKIQRATSTVGVVENWTGNTTGYINALSFSVPTSSSSNGTIIVRGRTAIKLGGITTIRDAAFGRYRTLFTCGVRTFGFLFTGKTASDSQVALYGATFVAPTSTGASYITNGNEILGYSSTTDYTAAVNSANVFDGVDGPYAIINYNDGYLKLARLRAGSVGMALKDITAIATIGSLGSYCGSLSGASGAVFYGSVTILGALPLITKVSKAYSEISGFTKTRCFTNNPGEVFVLDKKGY